MTRILGGASGLASLAALGLDLYRRARAERPEKPRLDQDVAQLKLRLQHALDRATDLELELGHVWRERDRLRAELAESRRAFGELSQQVSEGAPVDATITCEAEESAAGACGKIAAWRWHPTGEPEAGLFLCDECICLGRAADEGAAHRHGGPGRDFFRARAAAWRRLAKKERRHAREEHDHWSVKARAYGAVAAGYRRFLMQIDDTPEDAAAIVVAAFRWRTSGDCNGIPQSDLEAFDALLADASAAEECRAILRDVREWVVTAATPGPWRQETIARIDAALKGGG